MSKNGMSYNNNYLENSTNTFNLSPFTVKVFTYSCLFLGITSATAISAIEYFNLDYPLTWEVKLYPLFLTIIYYVLKKEFQGIKNENEIDEQKTILLLGAIGSVTMVVVAFTHIWTLGIGIDI